MKANVLPYLITILFLIILFFIVDLEKWKVFSNVTITNMIVSLLFAYTINNISGLQYFLVRKQYGVSLKLRDILLFPSVMGLWSFIFPLKGSLFFSTLFFNKKYNMKISESLSISIYLYLVTISFTGLLGLLFAILYSMVISWFSFISLVLLINPVLIWLANRFLKRIGNSEFKMIAKFQVFSDSVIKNINFLWQNRRFSALIIIIKTIHLFVSILWLYYISISLYYELSFFEVTLISLVMSASIIIKFTPGNLGTSQLIAGGFMGLIGGSPEQAVLITLFASITVMMLNFTVGVFGNFYYFKTIDFLGLINNSNKPTKY